MDKLINLRCWIGVISLVTCFNTVALCQSIVFNTQDFPPFSYYIGDKVAGPVAQIIEESCKLSVVTCTFKLLPWIRAQKEVENGKAHALFVIGRNSERYKWLYFSPPILKTEYGFFVRSDNSLIYSDLQDIRGYTVGVYGPSNTSNKLNQLMAETDYSFSINMRPDDESGFKNLSAGRIHAVFSHKDSGFAVIAKLHLDSRRYAGTQCRLNYYIGFSKEYTEIAVANRFRCNRDTQRRRNHSKDFWLL